MVIGLFMHTGYVTWPVFDGALQAARDLGVQVVTFTIPTAEQYFNMTGADVARIYPPLEGRLDGVAFAFPGAGLQAYAQTLWTRGVPTVLIARKFGDVPQVGCANDRAIHDLVTRLHARGHRRIAYLDGPRSILSANERLAGFHSGLEACGLAADSARIIRGDFHEETARKNVRATLAHDRDFTALVCSNDLGALGALAALRDAGLRVPEDVEVSGFDNILRGRWSHPSLTTCDFPLFEMAYVAIEELVKNVRRETFRRDVALTATYVPRHSTRDGHEGENASGALPEQRHFQQEIGLARLRRQEGVPELLAELEGCVTRPNEFLRAFRRLLRTAAAAGAETTCLNGVLLQLERTHGGGASESFRAALAAGFGLLAHEASDEQLRRSESAALFHSASRILSELAYAAVEEAAVIEVFRSTLRNLDLPHAGLFVTAADDENAGGGAWYWWESTGLAAPAPQPLARVADLDLARCMAQARDQHWLLAPLFYNDRQFGLLLLPMAGDYLVHYPDLVRHLATALHGARIYNALQRRNEELRAAELFYHSLVESLPQIIVRKDAHGVITYANQAFADLLGRPLAEIIGRDESAFYPAEEAAKFRADDAQVMASGRTLEFESVVEKKGQPSRYMHVKKVPLFDAEHRLLGVQALFWDMTIFRETEERLKETQHELVEASRLAGIAEVTTGILHNLGNVLSSVNTSAALLLRHARQPRTAALGKVAALVNEQRPRLAEFFTTDPRGRVLPEYLGKLAEQLDADQASAVKEAEDLRHQVDHALEIVAAQQNFARVAGTTENLPVADLVEHALRISESSLNRHGVTLMREFMATPVVQVERQKVMQILVNLIRNAKDSVKAHDRPNKRIVLSVRPAPSGAVQVAVTDNGLGIAPQNLERLFNFGFTTKKNGHGFGLHASILAAKEMGGSLTASSDGEGQGATFVLELPAAPVRAA